MALADKVCAGKGCASEAHNGCLGYQLGPTCPYDRVQMARDVKKPRNGSSGTSAGMLYLLRHLHSRADRHTQGQACNAFWSPPRVIPAHSLTIHSPVDPIHIRYHQHIHLPEQQRFPDITVAVFAIADSVTCSSQRFSPVVTSLACHVTYVMGCSSYWRGRALQVSS